jgi:hypothetical protein
MVSGLEWAYCTIPWLLMNMEHWWNKKQEETAVLRENTLQSWTPAGGRPAKYMTSPTKRIKYNKEGNIWYSIDPLLGNDSVNTFQRDRTRAKIGLLLDNRSANTPKTIRHNRKRCFPRGPHRGYITRSSKGVVSWFRVEAGSNTSTVTLRVVGGDEKGSLESETVKFGRESHGTRTRQ